VAPIAFFRWLLGRDSADARVVTPVEDVAPTPQPEEPAPVIAIACPNCGVTLDPPPVHSRRCPSCRHPIVVRHLDGRAIYLTESAVATFESERRRELDEVTWTRERQHWLHLARMSGAPADRRRRLAARPLTAASVAASRALYLGAAERAARAARRDKRWDELAQIRRRQAAELFAEAGGSVPPADELVALYREGVAATLRKIAELAREAELVGASCCPACRADNGRIFRITDELRTPRLPHAGCPRGLCACDWWPAVHSARPKRRRARAAPPSPSASGGAADDPASDQGEPGTGA
jgi:hypothetical protein